MASAPANIQPAVPSSSSQPVRREKRRTAPEAEDPLYENYLQTRNYFFDKSQLLFSLKQNYMKKLEVFKHQKEKNKENRSEYFQNITELAKKDAELRYQRQVLLNSEIQWNNRFLQQLAGIESKRVVLQNQLAVYRGNRQQITALQQRIHLLTEQNRMNSLNSVVFMNYSKSILENEMRKSYLGNRLFHQRKEMLRLTKFYNALLAERKSELRAFQVNKINIFRRYERILLGKSKEHLEQQLQQAALGSSFDFISLSAGAADEAGDEETEGPEHIGPGQLPHLGQAASNSSPSRRSTHHKRQSGLAATSSQQRASLLKAQLPLPQPYGPVGQGQLGEGLAGQQDVNGLMYQMMSSSFLDEEDEDDRRVADTLENRVAQRILVVDLPELFPQLQASLQVAQSLAMSVSEEEEPLPSPYKTAPDKRDDLAKNRSRRQSIVQHGDFIQFVDRFNKTRPTNNNSSSGNGNTSSSTPADKQKRTSSKGTPAQSANGNGKGHVFGGGSLVDGSVGSAGQEKSSVLSFPDYPGKRRKKTAAANSNSNNQQVVIYDPQDFVETCSGDFLKQNTLLDLSRGIGDREERLLKLVDNCCLAKGKVRQLTAIRDGLNRELMKQACLLLSILQDVTGRSVGKATLVNVMKASPTNPNPVLSMQ